MAKDMQTTTARKNGDKTAPTGRIPDLWRRYLSENLGDGVAAKTYTARGDVPAVSGVYLMIADGVVEYVGQSVNIAYRIDTHGHQWWDSLAVVEMPDWWPHSDRGLFLDAMESLLIKRYSPSQNRAIVSLFMPFAGEMTSVLARLPDRWA